MFASLIQKWQMRNGGITLLESNPRLHANFKIKMLLVPDYIACGWFQGISVMAGKRSVWLVERMISSAGGQCVRGPGSGV